jgi:hypothetical protein
MSVDAGRYARRRADLRAAKERRQKRMLVVGLVLLAGVIALQGPKTLKRLHGPAPAASAPSTSTGSSRGEPARRKIASSDDAAARAFGEKDPFVAQVSVGGSDFKASIATAGPPVRSTSFVQKDPFIQQVTVGGSGTIAGSGQDHGTPAASTGGRYIVVLASLPTGNGRGNATRAAAQARGIGLGDVGVLVSSDYSTLRTGFYVVYAGPFTSLEDALRALTDARSKGFITAYSRRLGT